MPKCSRDDFEVEKARICKRLRFCKNPAVIARIDELLSSDHGHNHTNHTEAHFDDDDQHRPSFTEVFDGEQYGLRHELLRHLPPWHNQVYRASARAASTARWCPDNVVSEDMCARQFVPNGRDCLMCGLTFRERQDQCLEWAIAVDDAVDSGGDVAVTVGEMMRDWFSHAKDDLRPWQRQVLQLRLDISLARAGWRVDEEGDTTDNKAPRAPLLLTAESTRIPVAQFYQEMGPLLALAGLPANKWRVGGDLDLSDNELTSLPASLGGLMVGHRLFLSYNQLTSLPDTFGGLTVGTDLFLSDNQLTSPLPALPNVGGRVFYRPRAGAH